LIALIGVQFVLKGLISYYGASTVAYLQQTKSVVDQGKQEEPVYSDEELDEEDDSFGIVTTRSLK
jgi:hypothetical protein